MPSISTLSTQFGLTIPESICQQMHWHAGQELVFIPKANGMLIMPPPELVDLAGMCKGANTEGFRDRQAES